MTFALFIGYAARLLATFYSIHWLSLYTVDDLFYVVRYEDGIHLEFPKAEIRSMELFICTSLWN